MDPNNNLNQPINPNSPYQGFSPSPSAPISSGTGAGAAPKPKKPLVFIIIAVLVLAALGVGAYFLFFNQETSPFSSPNETPLEPVEVLYVAPEDDDGSGLSDFIEEKIESSSTSGDETESFRYKMMALNLKTVNGEYDDVLAELKTYNPDSLSAEERFMLYNAYARVYQETGDTEKYDEYYNLALNAREEKVFGEN